MSDRYPARTLGYMGKVIPTDRLTNIVRDILAAQFGIPAIELDNVRAEPTLLLERVSEYGDAEYSTLIGEGVRGERPFSSNTLEVYCIQGFASSVIVPVGIPLLVEISKNAESADVAEFVRTFGDRLNTNVSLAQRWMREFAPVLVD